ncbi:glycosyltransferase family 2 protein [uncultured Tateyamaria sp.]|uniref:glycosyltransferase family 2 protein n=1 Tax=uncultured Tateyamaria sp. TaxID=455651 RepID=UPI00260DB8EB|nr:glycosyltransferase family 2 protein [uncultured Tateyamaria sp.]
MPTLSDIQIVTVAYNSTGVIGDMLASVPNGVKIVIVDNASTDADTLRTLADRHEAQVVTNPVNRGFGAACNIGSAIGNSPYLLFLNPDAQLGDGCLQTLLAAAAALPEAAAFVPNVRDRRGRPAFRRRSNLLPRSSWWTGSPPDADTDVPLLNGSAVFVPRARFDAVGGFDTDIFLYHEDDDLSLRLAALGPLRFVHNAVVHHAEGHGNARTPASAVFKAWHMGRSRVYATAKHGRPAPFLSSLKAALAQLASPLAWTSKRKRAKQMSFLRGILSARSDGGRGARHPDSSGKV